MLHSPSGLRSIRGTLTGCMQSLNLKQLACWAPAKSAPAQSCTKHNPEPCLPSSFCKSVVHPWAPSLCAELSCETCSPEPHRTRFSSNSRASEPTSPSRCPGSSPPLLPSPSTARSSGSPAIWGVGSLLIPWTFIVRLQILKVFSGVHSTQTLLQPKSPGPPKSFLQLGVSRPSALGLKPFTPILEAAGLRIWWFCRQNWGSFAAVGALIIREKGFVAILH